MGAALQAMHDLALSVAASGATPSFILLTDGAANVARDGTKSRSAGTEDAMNAAKAVSSAGYRGILVDTATRPSSSGTRACCCTGRRLPTSPQRIG